jgi:hypothetical protein
MSQSFGTPEILVSSNNTQIQQAHKNYQAAQAAGITVLASAGDFGATNGFSTANANYPASDPALKIRAAILAGFSPPIADVRPCPLWSARGLPKCHCTGAHGSGPCG